MALLDPALAAALQGEEGSQPFTPSNPIDTVPLGFLGQVMPTVDVPASDHGIRLNHLRNDRHDIRNPETGEWYQFINHQLIVETEEEAQWLEDLLNGMAGEVIIARDNLPAPIPCLICQARNEVFTTRCLDLYIRHMWVKHQ